MRRLQPLAAGCVIAAIAALLAGSALGRRAEVASGDPWVQLAALTDPPDSASGVIGESVAISGDTLVVSARFANGGKGEVLVYTKPASGWADATAPTATLTPSDGANGDQFGESVAISGDTIVVGAYGHAVSGHSAQGAAYVFVKPAAGWHDATQNAELTSTSGAAADHFGYSVGVSGSTVVVGAPGHNVAAVAPMAGEGYVFVKPAGGWSGTLVQTADLELTGFASGDLFGVSVGISGNTVVGGADGRLGKGAAFVFLKPGAGWSGTVAETATLTASDGATNDGLGSTVAIDGSTVVAGSPSHKIGSIATAGAVDLYVKPPSGWTSATQTAELTESDPQTNDGFGESIAVSGSEVLGGSAGNGNMAARASGDVYVFVEPAAGWAGAPSQSAEFPGPDTAHDAFGSGVATDGATAVAGASALDAAYVFDPGATATVTTPANGAVYTQGQPLAAAYACTASAPATLSSCAGTVAPGGPVDTSTAGPHTFSVTATASDGVTATRTATYTVNPPTPVPALGKIRVSNKTFRRGSILATLASEHHAHKPPVGTTFTFTLNTAATVELTFTQRVSGRKSGGKCVKQTKRNKHKHACKRTTTAGALELTGHAGTDAIAFQGILSKHHKLNPGTYRLAMVATDATGHSKARTAKFTIVTP